MEEIENIVKQLVPPKKVVLYCPHHQSKELDLYCETCEELICLHCTVKKHKDHQYDLVVDTFETHKAEMTAYVEPVENHISIAIKTLEELRVRLQELDDQRVDIKGDIQQQIQLCHELIEVRKVELFNQVDQHVEMNKKNVVAQRDKVETVVTQRESCLSFVKESLGTAHQGEVLRVKKTVMKQMKEMTDNFKPDTLSPCEQTNVKFVVSSELEFACQQFGKMYLQETCRKKCINATGKSLERVNVGEGATQVLHVVDDKNKACSTPVETVICERMPEGDSKKIKCALQKTEASQYASMSPLSLSSANEEPRNPLLSCKDSKQFGQPLIQRQSHFFTSSTTSEVQPQSILTTTSQSSNHGRDGSSGDSATAKLATMELAESLDYNSNGSDEEAVLINPGASDNSSSPTDTTFLAENANVAPVGPQMTQANEITSSSAMNALPSLSGLGVGLIPGSGEIEDLSEFVLRPAPEGVTINVRLQGRRVVWRGLSTLLTTSSWSVKKEARTSSYLVPEREKGASLQIISYPSMPLICHGMVKASLVKFVPTSSALCLQFLIVVLIHRFARHFLMVRT